MEPEGDRVTAATREDSETKPRVIKIRRSAQGVIAPRLALEDDVVVAVLRLSVLELAGMLSVLLLENCISCRSCGSHWKEWRSRGTLRSGKLLLYRAERSRRGRMVGLGLAMSGSRSSLRAGLKVALLLQPNLN